MKVSWDMYIHFATPSIRHISHDPQPLSMHMKLALLIAPVLSRLLSPPPLSP